MLTRREPGTTVFASGRAEVVPRIPDGWQDFADRVDGTARCPAAENNMFLARLTEGDARAIERQTTATAAACTPCRAWHAIPSEEAARG